MMDISLLGTGGMMPLPNRRLTALYARAEGKGIVIDCGEGTQVGMRAGGWSFKSVDTLLITHFHADHISGLPGFLLTMANSDRVAPLTMIGPKGLAHVVNSLRVIVPELPFSIRFLEWNQETTIVLPPFRITGFPLSHGGMPCLGYTLAIDRAGRFDPIRARAAAIPLRHWRRLQTGETVVDGDQIYTPDMVMGAPRRGIKVTYATDTRPTPALLQHAMESDLFIGEGMYGEPDKQARAQEASHMTMQEVATLARDAHVRALWLTHYSPATPHPEQFGSSIRAIFPRTVVAEDGQTTTLTFEET